MKHLLFSSLAFFVPLTYAHEGHGPSTSSLLHYLDSFHLPAVIAAGLSLAFFLRYLLKRLKADA